MNNEQRMYTARCWATLVELGHQASADMLGRHMRTLEDIGELRLHLLLRGING